MSKLDPTKQQWCWAEKDAEQASGPFDSKEEAILEASTELGEAGVDIDIGRCMPFVPEEWASNICDLDFAIEKIEDFAGDNGWLIEDPVMLVKRDASGAEDIVGAEKALHAALTAWAREWLLGDTWRMDDNPERVKTIDVNAAPTDAA